MSQPDASRKRPLWGRLAIGLGLCLALFVLLLPWWRNHTLLIDFCDYGLVMAAAGRMNLGEHPYVDFLTPIQTLQFFSAQFAEWVFGPHYLSLTYINGVFIAGSFAGLTALLWKRLGAVLALLVATAVVVASSSQHTIAWYNAMGTTWLAIVMWITAEPQTQSNSRWFSLVLVWAALWLGGMTKLTYQVTALAFACAFAFRSGWLGNSSWRHAVQRILSYLLFGVIAPIGAELVYSGASFRQWLENVILLPARFRTGMLAQIATIRFYLHTPHDYYKPLHFAFAGAWGVGLLALTGGIAGYFVFRKSARRRTELTVLGVLLGGAWICGGVLLATNMDIAFLSGSAWLVLATGVALAFKHHLEEGGTRLMRSTLGVSALSLLVPAWFAAWDGTRALWGHEPLERSAMVTTDDLPGRFSYMKGMRISPPMHESLRQFAAKQDELSKQGVPASAYYFVNATDWMVRIVPQARHPNLPLWLAGGTTFSPDDAKVIANRISNGNEIQVILSHEAWNYWYPAMQKMLASGFQTERLGLRLFCNIRRDFPDPLEFANNTQSNLYFKDISVRGISPQVRLGQDGLFYLGGSNPHRMDLAPGLYRLTGETFGEFTATDGDAQPVKATFRVYARDGDKLTDLMWQENIELNSRNPTASGKFSVSPGGRPVSFILDMPPGASANIGWRRLKTQHSGPLQPTPPQPVNRSLAPHPLGQSEVEALFGSIHNAVTDVVGYGDLRINNHAGASELVSPASGEIWFKMDHQVARVSGDFGVSNAGLVQGPEGEVQTVSVIYYKSGRFDLQYRGALRPSTAAPDGPPQHFDINVPEGVGWIGLVVTTPPANRATSGKIWWRNIRLE